MATKIKKIHRDIMHNKLTVLRLQREECGWTETIAVLQCNINGCSEHKAQKRKEKGWQSSPEVPQQV